MKKIMKRAALRTTGLIALCFLLTSTGYLAWTYRVMELVSSRTADGISLAAGYLFQAAGLALFALLLRRKKEPAKRIFFVILFLHMLCLVPAVLGRTLPVVLSSGFLVNVFCGLIAGYYLYRLTEEDSGSSAVALGAGYGISAVCSWLVSLIGKGSVYYSDGVLIICLILTVLCILAAWKEPAALLQAESGGSRTSSPTLRLPKEMPQKTVFLLSGGLVLLFSIVNSCGFGFPSADLKVGISVEFSRLFYAAGLMIAGIVNDRERRYGAICALGALVIPFIMLALKAEPVPLAVFWALSYFAFGFYSVYRMILFSDLSFATRMIFLSGAGLMIGRIGDAAGEMLNILLSAHAAVLIIVTALLFFASMFLFFRIYQLLYRPETEEQISERERFNRFSARNDLSAREREVLRLLLQEKTNAEIVEALSVSESTVKFHIHNILQKTGCRNRVALLSAYSTSQE